MAELTGRELEAANVAEIRRLLAECPQHWSPGERAAGMRAIAVSAEWLLADRERLQTNLECSRRFCPMCDKCRTKTMRLKVIPWKLQGGQTVEIDCPACTTCGMASLDSDATVQIAFAQNYVEGEQLRADRERLSRENERLRAALADLAENGLRADLQPTRERICVDCDLFYGDYLKNCSDYVRSTARAALVNKEADHAD